MQRQTDVHELTIDTSYLSPSRTREVYDSLLNRPIPHSCLGLTRHSVADRTASVNELSRFVGDIAADFIHAHVSRVFNLVKRVSPDEVAEVWTRQSAVGGRGQEMHLDVDEATFEKAGVMTPPLLATVVYLTPHPIQGGATWVCTEYPLPEQLRMRLDTHVTVAELPELSQNWTRIESRPGQLISFDARFAHFVEPLESGDPRLTMPTNIFAHGSASFPHTAHQICNLDPIQFALLTRLPNPDLLRLRAELRQSPAPNAIVQPQFGDLDPAELETLSNALLSMPNMPG